MTENKDQHRAAATSAAEQGEARKSPARIRRRDLITIAAALLMLGLVPIVMLMLPERHDDLTLELVAGPDAGDRISVDTQGDTVLILEFWASWCRPCETTTERLNLIADRHLGIVEVIGINVDMDSEALGLHNRFGANYATAIDDTGELQARFDVDILPTIIVLQRGKVVERLEGVPDVDALDLLIRRLRHANP